MSIILLFIILANPAHAATKTIKFTESEKKVATDTQEMLDKPNEWLADRKKERSIFVLKDLRR